MAGEETPLPTHIVDMAFVKTTNRKDAYHALVNTILKDPRRYCNNCGASWYPNMPICCEDPQIGNNADVAYTIAVQCKNQRENALNEHASFNKKSIRFGLSLPVFIYEALDKYEKSHGRRLVSSDKDINFLMRCFPQYRIPRQI